MWTPKSIKARTSHPVSPAFRFIMWLCRRIAKLQWNKDVVRGKILPRQRLQGLVHRNFEFVCQSYRQYWGLMHYGFVNSGLGLQCELRNWFVPRQVHLLAASQSVLKTSQGHLGLWPFIVGSLSKRSSSIASQYHRRRDRLQSGA